MIVLIIFICATIILVLFLYLSVKNIDYLQNFKIKSVETKAKIKYIDKIGIGDSVSYKITVNYFDEEGKSYNKTKQEYSLESGIEEGKYITIRYMKTNPEKWLFIYDFNTIEKPKS